MATTILGPRFDRRHDAILRVAAVLDYLFGLLYALLAIRLALAFFEANRSAGFVRFIDGVTNPFYAPFRGIVPNESWDGAHPFVWSIAIAIVAYAILHGVIRSLLRLADRT